MDGGLDGLVGAVGKKDLVKCGCAVGVHGVYVVITVFIICWFSWFNTPFPRWALAMAMSYDAMFYLWLPIWTLGLLLMFSWVCLGESNGWGP